MGKCWEVRGCPPDMLDTCPISQRNALCVLNCEFAQCWSPRHKMSKDPALIFGEHMQSDIKAVKKICLICEFYLNYAYKSSKSSQEK